MELINNLRYNFPKHKNPYYHELKINDPESPRFDPNEWFDKKYPTLTKKFGPAFLVGTESDFDGFTITYPVHPNDDFFAGLMGGDIQYKLLMVYLPSEKSFYFYDYQVDAFCPISDQKVQALVSNYLLRCALDCSHLVDIRNLVVNFRTDAWLKQITFKAKTILECERSFFEGNNGMRRFVDGMYLEPTAEPSYEQFITKTIAKNSEAKLTVSDAFSRYVQFCTDNHMPILARAKFKDLLTAIIRLKFKLGLRHDILGDNGKQSHGWNGLECTLAPVVVLN